MNVLIQLKSALARGQKILNLSLDYRQPLSRLGE